MPSFARVQTIVDDAVRGVPLAAPDERGFSSPPAGVVFDTPEQIKRRGRRDRAAGRAPKAMPLGNVTGMTQAERGELRRWIDAGAPTR